MLATLGRAALHVQQAAGIGRDHDIGRDARDRIELGAQLRIGHLGMRQVVDAGAAAAPVGIGKLDEFDAGKRAQQLARRRAHLLRVREVAGVVVPDAQKVRTAPRALLQSLAGVEWVDLPNSDWCCGSAGIYNLTHADMADAQLARKLDSIETVSPDVVVASNPGCLLHMARGAKERGMDVPMLHLVEVLGRAYPA